MTTATHSSERTTQWPESVPSHRHSQAQHRYSLFMVALQDRDIDAWITLDDLSWHEGEPADNHGQLHPLQAREIAKLARRFHREGDRHNADRAELALNAAGLLLNELLPMTVAQSIQADQEKRRFHEMKTLLANAGRHSQL